MDPHDRDRMVADDVRTLERMGYQQELHRGMGAFSNFAISLSIICIVAGGLTSFHLGFCSVGGASIGLGWPLVCLFSLTVAATMGQIASAFPTAGGLYHWGSILGGRFWGWTTAWFNLAGLITVMAAINVGTYQFALGAFGPAVGYDPNTVSDEGKYFSQLAGVSFITLSQALINHRGIRLTTRLTDFSGYLILVVAVGLTLALLLGVQHFDFTRLWTFHNFSGYPDPEHEVWPPTANVGWLFLLGFLLPAYTMTGFDASAHTAEETVGASHHVPRGIVRSVLVSGVFGWVMLCAIVLAMPDLEAAAQQGDNVFFWTLRHAVRSPWAELLLAGALAAQYLCGLATVTSASRMAFAFARDGGLPFSRSLRRVSDVYRTPVPAIWAVAILALAFMAYTPAYATITAASAIFLDISYVLPAALGMWAYGRTWTRMGPWHLGVWYRPLTVLGVLGCGLIFLVGVQPPNEKVLVIVVGMLVVMAGYWLVVERRRFRGPPRMDVMA
jgi:amino acid transporter